MQEQHREERWLQVSSPSVSSFGLLLNIRTIHSRILCRHCQFQFCWLCLRNWDNHGYNDATCNAWKPLDPDGDMTEAQRNLEKWLFYFDRYNNHELSAKLDQELCERTEEKMVEVQETSQLSWIEVWLPERPLDP